MKKTEKRARQWWVVVCNKAGTCGSHPTKSHCINWIKLTTNGFKSSGMSVRFRVTRVREVPTTNKTQTKYNREWWCVLNKWSNSIMACANELACNEWIKHTSTALRKVGFDVEYEVIRVREILKRAARKNNRGTR